jgi:4-hydroxybutyrate CoA-transferase
VRVVTAEEAVAGIRSGQRVYVHAASAAPSVLLDALCARAEELEEVRVTHLHVEGPGPHLAPEMRGHFYHEALFIGPNARAAVNEGRAAYIPVFLHDVPDLFRSRLLPLDAALINLSPPDAHGFCSLGTSVEGTLAAVQAADTVIAQINASMPRTLGEGFVHVDDIDVAVEVAIPPYEHAPDRIGDVERRIGEFVADLIPDGATLQMGIGGVPSAVAMALHGKQDLGVHTEMFTDPVIDLVEAGVITGARKEVDQDKIVACFMMGSQRLYSFVHDNPMIEMRTADYTNDTHLIRQFSKMVAINSAIEIDLTGQVCADSIGWHLYSGVGGQMDFIRGAALSAEGQAIIALPSTGSHGAMSRIVPVLQEGAGVVTTRAHVRTVVTEWGVAQLYGASIRERARQLISIAHPDFRPDLELHAKLRHYL